MAEASATGLTKTARARSVYRMSPWLLPLTHLHILHLHLVQAWVKAFPRCFSCWYERPNKAWGGPNPAQWSRKDFHS